MCAKFKSRGAKMFLRKNYSIKLTIFFLYVIFFLKSGDSFKPPESNVAPPPIGTYLIMNKLIYFIIKYNPKLCQNKICS